MSSRRTARISQAILETVSTTILFDLKDPRVKNVTVISVEVSSDVRTAKVYVSIMGSENEQSTCLHGLNSARGFLQSKIGDRLKTRYTPVLKFVVDPGVKHSIETSRIIREAIESGETSPTNLDSPRQNSEISDPPQDSPMNHSETGDS